MNSVANLKEDAATYAAPATAFALGTAIQYNCGLFITECIKSQNIAKKELAKEFLDLLIQDLASSVNKTVNENMLTYKRQKKILLPKLDDIKILQSYLSENRKKYLNDLKMNGFSYKIWKELASSTLVSVQVFNRRRAGEIERALISDFSNYQAVTKDTDPEILKSLSQESQEATKRYVRFEIRGKSARGVPVLLSLELLGCANLILRHRESAAVPKENPFIFGLPCTGSKINNHLLATHLMRIYSTDCGAENPSTLRGTKLRKHIASQSAVFNLKENEVQDLANFMEHSDKIHRDHYQIPIITRDIAQISKILEQAQGSNKNNELQHERDYSDAQTNASSTTSSPKRYKKRKGVIHRKTRSTLEKRTARSIFHEHLMKNTLPSFKECIEAIKSHTNLESRTAVQLKLWVHNQNVNSKQKKDSMLSPRRRKHSWATPEKTAIREAFADHMKNNYPPSFSECRRAIETYPALKSRSVRMIKAYVYSNIRRKTQN